MGGVEIESVSKRRGDGSPVLSDVSLRVPDGGFLALAGPRGCGNSALLRMIAGLEEISEGTISIGGNIINAVPPKERDVAAVFPNTALYPHLTVYGNIAFGLRRRGLEAGEIDRRVREAAQALEIEELLDWKPKSLSGGQRCRAAIGRSLSRHPRVLLFDAPFTNLDARLRAEMRKEVSRLRARFGTTMMFATHDAAEAAALGGDVAFLREGRVERIVRANGAPV